MNNLIIVLLIGGLITGGLYWAIKREKTAEIPEGKIRKMAVAGSFYTADKEKLNTELDGYLKQTEKMATSGPVKILIVPHAGTVYSGLTAAWGYRQVMDEDFEKIIMLGASHKFDFSTAEGGNFDAFETPFGNQKINKILADNLKLGKRNDVFEGEHTLELQTIWIKKLWPEAKIVPILVSRPDTNTVTNLAFRIAQNFDDKTMLVVSTDLSHYFEYEQAKKLDQETVNKILTGEKIVPENACGATAVNIAQQVAGFLGAEKPVLLNSLNSGDTTSERNRVVGYASIGYSLVNPKLETLNLNENEKGEALKIAKETLDEYMKNKRIPEIATESATLNLPLGAFVTLRKKGELRGCIGEFEPDRPLYQVIMDKTVDAAVNDHRFEPVKASELEEIDLEISVMTPRQRVKSWEEVRLGTDGVVIVNSNSNRSGTFLPQVATETGWSKKEFMEQLCQQKAGLPANCYLDPKTEIFVFQAQVFE